jgi:DNA-binding transcriptional ArsR family regulator
MPGIHNTDENVRDLDFASLKALAHPLRVQIFDMLSTYGNFTASGLAERLGESSGATSYHLRQLAKHGFVEELEGMGSGRERWWGRVHGSVNVATDDVAASPAGRSSALMVYRQMRYTEDQLLDAWAERAFDEVSKEWRDAASQSIMNRRMTVDQLAEFTQAVMEIAKRFDAAPDEKVPGSRPVHITFNAFPVVDGDVTPGSKAARNSAENVGGRP